MFPIRDDNPNFLTPYVTWGLIAANVLAWLNLQGLGGEPALSTSVCRLGLIPAELLGTLPAGTRIELGQGLTCVLGEATSFLTMFSSMFLHGGWLHLIGNLWFLWIFGNNVEDSMGHARFLVFYLACGFAAAALQVVAESDSVLPMVGASGAIGGVMGAYVLLYPRVRVHLLFWFGFFFTTFSVPAYFMLGYWFLMQLFGGAQSVGATGGGVAFWAHIGGFLAGVVLIKFFERQDRVTAHRAHRWQPRRLH